MFIHDKIIIAFFIFTFGMGKFPAHAYLRSLAELSPGDYCNTECQTFGCPIMIAANFDIPPSYALDIPDCTSDYTDSYQGSCWLNKQQANYMICDSGMELGCNIYDYLFDFALVSGTTHYSYWERLNANAVIRKKMSIISGYDDGNNTACTVQNSPEYGCKENYYAISGTGTSSINCTACISSGRSEIGNSSVTGCYMPKDSSFSDSSGTGIYTANCYYK